MSMSLDKHVARDYVARGVYMLLEIRVGRVYMSLQIYVARETYRWRFMSLEKRVAGDSCR